MAFFFLPTASLVFTLLAPGPKAPEHARQDSNTVRGLPVVELRAAHPVAKIMAIVLSGDGGWADIDQRVGQRLQSRGIDVIGFDMKEYLQNGHRTPEGTAADIARVIRRYTGLWQMSGVALVGYSRGSDLAPFVVNRVPKDIRTRITLVALLTLLERASFTYHFSDLWRTTSRDDDLPILPELQQMHGIKLLCIYGRDEKESLCRTAPSGLMTVVARNGKHHFDGNYDALSDIIYDAITSSRGAQRQP